MEAKESENPSSWTMNKKIKKLIEHSDSGEVVRSICDGEDFGKRKNSYTGEDLKMLSKMGRQIDSTIMSDD